MNTFATVLSFAFPILFVGMWLTVMTILRNLSGMAKTLDVVTGDPLRRSRWGSASINGVNASNCVKLEEYPEGFVVRMMWMFGGGRLWLPKAGLQVGDELPKRFFVARRRTLISGINQVILFGRLADFVASTWSNE
jgi:hypothetical protein